MAAVVDRQSLIDYCLRRLGFPVIQINVDDDQLNDRIDDAMQFFQDYHFDAVEKIYFKHELTQQDIDQQYLNLDPKIIGVTRIFPLNDSALTPNMFDLRYQLRLNDLYDFTNASYVSYVLTMQHLRTLELLFTGEVPIRFNRHQQKLFIDWNWGTPQADVGQMVIAECYAIVDANEYPNVWNDRWLKMYATALIKRQWGENMKKFGGVSLPGGIQLNGDKIWQEADLECKKIEDEIEARYELPAEFMIG